MDDKDYKDWLNEAKTELDEYSAQQEEISKLYQQAVSHAEKAYQAGKEQLTAETVRQKNQAATDTMRAGRNLKQSLASRGLAFSGENAQTDVDLTLSLRDRMGEIDSDALARQQEWDRQHLQTVTDLQRDHAQHRGDAALKLSQLKAELASAELAAAEKEAQGGNSHSDLGQPAPGAGKGSMAEKAAAMLAYMQQTVKEKIKGATVTPDVSPRDLAKQMIKSAGGNGSISGYTQSQALESLLEKLNQTYLLDSAYRNELLLNLYSMGYNPDYKTDFTKEVEALQEGAAEAFDLYYDRYFDVYYYAGYSVNESDRMANEKAQFLQMVFLYRNSYTMEMFESAVREMGYGSKLNAFYDEIAKEPDNYVLGSETKILRD